MTILKAATWQSSQPGSSHGGFRRVIWGSTSEKVTAPFIDFRGKVILLTNSIPKGRDTEAFLSRCLTYSIQFDRIEVAELLREAAKSTEHFPNSVVALEVAEFLCEELGVDLSRVNLRTLKLGYELAMIGPSSWQELLGHLLPRERKQDVVANLAKSGLPSHAQEASFQSITGKSRRTFYYQKRRLGLSRDYGSGAKTKMPGNS